MTRSLRALCSSVLALTVVLTGCEDEARSPLDVANDDSSPFLALSECVLHASDTELGMRMDALEAGVEALADAGALNGGQARALTNHLTNARRSLEAGDYCAVQDQLNAFRDQLEELTGDGVLSDRQAYDLRHASRLALFGSTYQSGDPEEYAPGVTGEVRTVSFQGESLRVEVIDGLAIFNGDIILGFADELDGPTGAGPSRVGVCDTCTRWSGSVGFGFADDWGDAATNQFMRDEIVAAINHLRDVTGIEFERRTTGERVVFRNSTGCSSMVGRQVVTGIEPQYINMAVGCEFGAAVHEILHALGIWHEQSRNDRDDYVMVDLGAVLDGRESNFDKFGNSGLGLGPYNFASVMHYRCGDFRRPDATNNPITPIAPEITCADIRPGERLTEGDIAGVYWLYPPGFSIVGATSGDVADRFELSLAFTSEPVPDEYIKWGAVGMGFLGTGPTFSTVDAGLLDGEFRLFAQIFIAGVRIATRVVDVTIVNTPPSVSLGPDREVELNRVFSVFADVTDAEDGSCPPPICTYEWDPEPLNDRGGAADYYFATVGMRQISVTVTDGAGLSDSDDVNITVVDSPPTPFITSPGPGSTFSAGATVSFTGYATDPNYGPGPDDGVLPCDRLHWTSSDLSDLVSPRDDCTVSVTFGNAGSRTVTLRATDFGGLTGTTSIVINVEDCPSAGCPPDVVLNFETEPDLNGSQYDPPFTEPGYLLDTPIVIQAFVTDVDGPPTVVALEWEVTGPCLGLGCTPPVFAIGSTGVFAPGSSYVTWTPSDDIDEWSSCILVPLPYVVSVTATDGNGNSRTVSRTFYLACTLI